MGYAEAGFEVVGIDLHPQPRYPFEFHQGDAIAMLWDYVEEGNGSFDAIHASPPCQAHSDAQRIRGNEHPDLIWPTRQAILQTGLPYVIENVVGARDQLIHPVELCGAMFGLQTYRHRLFETNWPLWVPRHPEHVAKQTKMGRAPKDDEFMHIVGNFSGVDRARDIMGMPWASRDGLREAIPPAYTRCIGTQLAALIAEAA
jgi:DNA (cytosine-5)-methyltransferase 1